MCKKYLCIHLLPTFSAHNLTTCVRIQRLEFDWLLAEELPMVFMQLGQVLKVCRRRRKKKPKKKQLTQSHTSLPAPNGAELPSCLTYSKCLVHMPLNIRPYLSQFNRCVQFETFFFLQLQILEVSFVFDHMVRPPLESLRRGTPENVYLCCSC